MSHQTQQFTNDQPVTVTIDDGHGETLVVDGFVQRAEFFAITDMSRSFSNHTPVDRYWDGARAFVVVESASGQDFGQTFARWRTGPDHMFAGSTLWVAAEGAAEGPRATVAPADAEALARIEVNLSPERIVNKAIDALAETDPVLAQRLRGAVEDIETAAYTRGGDNATDY